MDVMSLLSGGSVIGNVSQVQVNKANESGNFNKQLIGLVNGQSEEVDSSITSSLSFSLTSVVTGEQLNQIELEGVTSEQLDHWLEKLITDLEELENLELAGVPIADLDQLLAQLSALIQVISLTNANYSANNNNSLQQTNELTNSQQQGSSVVKLQDQLLAIQQLIQEQSSKLLQGKSIESIVTEQLRQIDSKIGTLLQEARAKFTSQSGEQSLHNSNFVSLENNANADSLLTKMNQQSAFVEAAVKVTSNLSTTNELQISQDEQQTNLTQNVLVSNVRTDNVKELFPQLTKSGTSSTNTYVLVDDFADTMRGLIVDKFSVTKLDGVTEAKLQLTPDHLGQVDVRISMHNGIMTATFQTETAMAKDALENQMIQLRASLAAQGITVEKIEVSQSTQSSQLNQEQRSSQQQDQQNGKNKQKTFNDALEDEIMINSVIQDLGYGRAVNETV